jgi:hypothetical protein
MFAHGHLQSLKDALLRQEIVVGVGAATRENQHRQSA